jgi:hypothetical protein
MFAWNAFILTKQTITSYSDMEKFRNVNFRPMIEFAVIKLGIKITCGI